MIADIGFTDARMGFDAKTCGVLNTIQTQSPDIAMGVDTGGAGDQGLMFGYACDESEELMPLPIMLAHKLVRQLSEIRRFGKLSYLRPDGKSQVSVEYVDGKTQAHRRRGGLDAARRRRHHRATARGREEAHHRSGDSLRAWWIPEPSITSIPPDVS